MHPLAAAALVALAASEPAPSPPALRVYVSGTYMPLHGTSGAERVGIEPELAAALAAALGRRLELVDRSSTGADALGSVATGKADLALSAVTPTPERAQRVDFTRPYHAVELRLAGPPLASLSDLAGKRVAVASAVTAALAREAKLPGTFVRVKTVRDALAAVVFKQADYALDEDLALLAEIRGTPLALVGPKVADSPIAAAVPKGRAAEWDAVLARIGPEIERIRRRWRRYHATFEQLDAGCAIHCGVLSGGELACFGEGAASLPPPPGTFTTVTAGDRHACALRSDGRLACWGDGEAGRAKPPAGEFVKVSAGSAHTCALAKGGTIACWGSNASGESAAPPGTFSDVAAGVDTSCAIRSRDHAVVCWGKRPLSLLDRHYLSVAVGGGMCALAVNGEPTCAGSGRGGGRPYALQESFLEVAAGSKALCGLRAESKVSCWDGAFPGDRALPITGISLQCGVLCGLAPDGAPVCTAEDPGARSPQHVSVRLAGGEEVLVAGPREASGALPTGDVLIAYCDVKRAIRGEVFGEGTWKLAAVLDSAGALRAVDEQAPPPAPGTWHVAGGSPKHRVKLGAPCSGLALATSAPLTPAPELRSARPGVAGERWATVRGPFGDASLGLLDEPYDPVITGGYTEEELTADWGDVGTGGLRARRCLLLVSRVLGSGEQEVMLPDAYACGEGD